MQYLDTEKDLELNMGMLPNSPFNLPKLERPKSERLQLTKREFPKTISSARVHTASGQTKPLPKF